MNVEHDKPKALRNAFHNYQLSIIYIRRGFKPLGINYQLSIIQRNAFHNYQLPII